MKKFAVLLALLALAFSCCALADADIVAQGTATIMADPDLARVNSGASLRASSIAEAQEKVAAVVAAATENLEAMGIAKEDIVTDYYSCYPAYDYNGTQEEPQIIGYQAGHSLVVTCRDLSRLDEVLGIMTESGMTEFNGITFDCTNRHDLYLEALKSAVRTAREKAEVLSAESGLTLGRVDKVTEQGYSDMVYAEAASGDAQMLSKRDAGAGIRGGTVGVSASVTVEFEAR